MGFISLSPPKDFYPCIEAAGCCCEYGDKILLLKRSPHKPQGMTWNLPGGKLDEGETPRVAAVREVFEETSIRLQANGLEEMDKFYVQAPGTQNNCLFYLFRTQLSTCPAINLNLEEHTEAAWVTIEEALKFPLIYGGAKVFLRYRKFVSHQHTLKAFAQPKF